MACVVREEDNSAFNNCHYELQRQFEDEIIRSAMLNKNWNFVWNFQLKQIMRANNVLGIIDGNVKRPMTIMGLWDTKQKDINNWNCA